MSNTSRNYQWFDATTTLCYLCLCFEYIFQHFSSSRSFLKTTLSLSQSSNTSSRQPKKKIKIQPTLSNRLPSFHIYPSHKWLIPYHTSNQKPLSASKPTKITATPLIPYALPRTDNILFTGEIEPIYLTGMSDSCPTKLGDEMLPSRSGI